MLLCILSLLCNDDNVVTDGVCLQFIVQSAVALLTTLTAVRASSWQHKKPSGHQLIPNVIICIHRHILLSSTINRNRRPFRTSSKVRSSSYCRSFGNYCAKLVRPYNYAVRQRTFVNEDIADFLKITGPKYVIVQVIKQVDSSFGTSYFRT